MTAQYLAYLLLRKAVGMQTDDRPVPVEAVLVGKTEVRLYMGCDYIPLVCRAVIPLETVTNAEEAASMRQAGEPQEGC